MQLVKVFGCDETLTFVQGLCLNPLLVCFGYLKELTRDLSHLYKPSSTAVSQPLPMTLLSHLILGGAVRK